MISEDWLKRINKEFQDKGVEQKKRPWEALRRYSIEFNAYIDFDSDIAKYIFNWFETRSKPGTHQIGSLYESVYFYDTQFWSVSIPLTMGREQPNPLDSLFQMPDVIKDELIESKQQALSYKLFWANCIDYGYGINDIKNSNYLDRFGFQLLMSADQELRAAISILKRSSPDSRAILPCTMAVEIFFKSYIALKKGLTEKEAKYIGHDLNKGLDKFIETSGFGDLEKIREKLKMFPKIHERYQEQNLPKENLWHAFSLSQSLGALIIREYTDRNMVLGFRHPKIRQHTGFAVA